MMFLADVTDVCKKRLLQICLISNIVAEMVKLIRCLKSVKLVHLGHKMYVEDVTNSKSRYLDAYTQQLTEVRHPSAYSSKQYFPYSKHFWNNTKTKITRPSESPSDSQEKSPYTFSSPQEYLPSHTSSRPLQNDICRLPEDRYTIEYIVKDTSVVDSQIHDRLSIHDFTSSSNDQLMFAAMMHRMMCAVDDVYRVHACVDVDAVFDFGKEICGEERGTLVVRRIGEELGEVELGDRFEKVFGFNEVNRFRFSSIFYPEITNTFVSLDTNTSHLYDSLAAKIRSFSSMLQSLITAATLYKKSQKHFSKTFPHLSSIPREDFISLLCSLGLSSHSSNTMTYIFNIISSIDSIHTVSSIDIDAWIVKLSTN